MHSTQRAFTLLELAMVLAIVALISGGILASSEMIHSAEMRSYMRDIKAMRDATNQFKTQYRYLPGDMPNATQYWGAISDNRLRCARMPGTTGTLTCNGNGNGVIDLSEQFLFWRHLSNGKFIKGTYTGALIDNGGPPLEIGVNVMGLTKDLIFHVNYDQYRAGDFFFNNISAPISILQLRKVSSHTAGALTAAEALNIDSKMDDGKPAYGTILGAQQSWPSAPAYGALPALQCSTSDTPATATYNTPQEGKNCIIGIILSGKPAL